MHLSELASCNPKQKQTFLQGMVQTMKPGVLLTFLLSLFLGCGMFISHGEAAPHVLYYVKPTSQSPDLHCLSNDSCPTDHHCYTIDYYANNSDSFFSAKKVSVTLQFMCGIHNSTVGLDIRELKNFHMVGMTNTVVFNMSRHSFAFFDIANVTIESLRIDDPSFSFSGDKSAITLTNSFLSGSLKSPVVYALITVTDGCEVVLNFCTIQRNVFINVNYNSTLTVRNSMIKHYPQPRQLYACITANNSNLVISGKVSFTGINNFNSNHGIGGTVLYINESVLSIQREAHLHFSNNYAPGPGQSGSVIYLSRSSEMLICCNALLEFVNNTMPNSGAIHIDDYSTLNITDSATVNFTNNKAIGEKPWVNCGRGAICITSSSFMNIHDDTRMYFVNNSADQAGGAIGLYGSTLNLHDNARMYFINNSAGLNGGAIYCRNSASVNINDKAYMEFTGNTAMRGNGGAIEIFSGQMTVNSTEGVLFSRNTAGQGGGAIHLEQTYALSVMMGKVYFYNNSATYGGAVQLNSSTLAVHNPNATLTFSRNLAINNGGAINMNHSTLIVYDNAMVHFIDNTAVSGGAIDLFTSDVTALHAQMEFTSNFALELGGALYLDTTKINISDNASVTYTGNTAFQGGAIFQYSANMTIQNGSRVTFENNTSTQGGGIYAISKAALHMKLNGKSNLSFVNNTAMDIGGGICVAAQEQHHITCFDPENDQTGRITFNGNSAENGGDHIYGASLLSDECKEAMPSESLPIFSRQDNLFNLRPSSNESISPISSEPKRICLCDSQNRPQCAKFSKVFVPTMHLYPGQTLQLSAVVAGLDLGTTRGGVYANFLSANESELAFKNQYKQLIPNKHCFTLKYTIHSESKHNVLYLQPKDSQITTYGDTKQFHNSLHEYNSERGSVDRNLLTSPVFINITFLPCPPGFTLYGGSQLPGCECYSVLAQNNFNCSFINDTGYLMWNNTVWVNEAMLTNNDSQSTSPGIIYNKFCPLDYCKPSQKTIDLQNNPDGQCDYHHAGRLCGGCKENYSLAIGSSHCISCPNNNNLVLLLFFAAAGVLLTLFILILNLTVTEGLVNGILFYANVVWAYNNIIFPPTAQLNPALYILKVFIAWMNLDFGIETCFIKGLDAFWKTWLQFVFPFYIWAIAGFIILTAHFSTRATYVIGDRAVPLLATIISLSYMKVLQTIVTSLSVAMISVYPEGSSYAVWYQDGNLLYFGQPHIYLFVAALIALVFLWLPYTLILLLMQWLRKNTHMMLLRWIPRFHPFYDNNFAPLNDNHRYWFGTLLVIRAFLLLIVTLTADISPSISLLVLLTTVTLLLLYKSIAIIYKQKSVSIFENICFVNLLLLCGAVGLGLREDYKVIIAGLSLGFTFFQFCSIIIWNLIKKCKCTQKCLKQLGSPKYVQIGDDVSSDNN